MKSMPRERKIHSKMVYESDFITLKEDLVRLPSGKEGKRIVVNHIGAAATLPITKAGDVLLVRQHRYAVGEDVLEIPAGKKDTPDEDGKVCAKRELEEETGYSAQNFIKLQSVYTAIGFSNELVEIYLARDVYPMDHPPSSDEEEYVDLVKMPLSAAIKLAENGEIKDAKTALALLSLKV